MASGEEYCEQVGEAEGPDAKHGMGVTSGDGYCGKVGKQRGQMLNMGWEWPVAMCYCGQVGEAEELDAKHGMT